MVIRFERGERAAPLAHFRHALHVIDRAGHHVGAMWTRAVITRILFLLGRRGEALAALAGWIGGVRVSCSLAGDVVLAGAASAGSLLGASADAAHPTIIESAIAIANFAMWYLQGDSRVARSRPAARGRMRRRRRGSDGASTSARRAIRVHRRARQGPRGRNEVQRGATRCIVGARGGSRSAR
jgi:hypothetical protein